MHQAVGCDIATAEGALCQSWLHMIGMSFGSIEFRFMFMGGSGDDQFDSCPSHTVLGLAHAFGTSVT